MLVAIPLFTFAGFVLSAGHAPRRLVRLSQALLGWLPGRARDHLRSWSCALFTAFTGASGVTIIALGAVLIPRCASRIRRALQSWADHGIGQPRPAVRAVAAAHSVWRRRPGADRRLVRRRRAARDSDDRAAVGLQLWRNRRCPAASRRAPARPFGPRSATRAGICRCPFVVLGGIYSGYFAVSEAAAVTALYVTIVELVILREVRWRDLPGIMRESMVLVGAIFVILGVSLASTNYMIDAGVPQQMFALVSQYVSGPSTFLLVLLVFLLILGAILDIFSATVLVVPLLLPDRVAVRRQSGSPRNHLSRGDGARLPDAAARAEPVHREPQIRQGHHGNLLGHPAFPDRLPTRGDRSLHFGPDCL